VDGDPAETAESWIDLERFGSEPSPPPEKDRPVGRDFKVEFGQTLRARTFSLHVIDDRLVKQPNPMPPTAELEGRLTGCFDFELTRGQGAQTFP
jgi:hypothetical protein